MLDRQGRLLLCLVFLLVVFSESTFGRQAEPLRSFADKVALLELRSTLGLRSKEWPIKEDPCLVWVGVQCDNGSVVGLNVSGFRRTRLGKQNPQFVVDALGNLTSLAYFNASSLLLPGSIPDWFGQRMTSLQVLDLSSCSVTGVIPLSVGNLTNLTDLYLSDNSLTGNIPWSLGQLSRLSVLDLSKNSLTGPIPASLGNLGNLSRLDMSSNFLFEAIPLGIGNLSKLQYLNLSNNNLHSPIPAQIGGLSSLVDLDLSSNSLSGSIPRNLSRLRNLRKMILGNNILGGALQINRFPAPSQLEIVVLRYNRFSNRIPDVLWSLPVLRLLDVAGNNFTGPLPDITLNANATSAVLNISQNKFYGKLTPLLNRFSLIDLSWNYFEGKVPDYARNNASLDQNCLQSVAQQRSLEECNSFYADRGLVFDNFGQPNSTQPRISKGNGKSHKKVVILAAVLGGVGLIILLGLLILLLICCRKGRTANQRGTDAGPTHAGASSPPGSAINLASLGDVLTYQQLLQATSDFSDTNLIKHGHSGDLFRGIMENGTPVVIKRISMESNKKETHLTELDIFSRVSHTRLVPLLAHCMENENEKFLVYKHMPNGDLSSSLFRKTSSEEDGLQSLDWITRLKIALGAAEGLVYLHHECTPPLVHRDVQASSILLDDKFEVRLGSLSEVRVQEGDTHQSVITRLLRLPTQSSEQGAPGSPPATCAYDVYCFGKVLLELVTGKLGISASNDTQLKGWLETTLPYINVNEKELVTNIVDPSLIIDDDLLEEVWAISIVARSCLNPKPSKRPLMRYILKALENPQKVVREDSDSSEGIRTSSRVSWNAALFGSWRSSSDVAVIPGSSNTKMEAGTSMKRSGTSGSQLSGQNVGNSSSSRRRHSTEIFPEPSNPQDIERPQIQE